MSHAIQARRHGDRAGSGAADDPQRRRGTRPARSAGPRAVRDGKTLASDVGFSLATMRFQPHGGHGYLKDFPGAACARPARPQILEGTNEIIRVINPREMFRQWSAGRRRAGCPFRGERRAWPYPRSTGQSAQRADARDVRRDADRLSHWKADEAIQNGRHPGAGERAFCAGGDIRALYESAAQATSTRSTSIATIRLNAAVNIFQKPYVGVAARHRHGRGGGRFGAWHPLADPSASSPMPETGIGPSSGCRWQLLPPASGRPARIWH